MDNPYFNHLSDDFLMIRRRLISDEAIHPNNWGDIFEHLLKCRKQRGDVSIPEPPVPLILGGYNALEGTKFHRFNEIIEWCIKYDYLTELEKMIKQNEDGFFMWGEDPDPSSDY